MIFRSLRAAVPHLLVLSLSLSLLALPAFADSDSDEDETKKTMTGVWITRPAAPFVYQDPDGFELGVAAPVKEITLMRWELEEDENGLITGYNTYYSMDDQGGSQSRGTLCMVGARQGSKVLLSEAYAVYDGYPVPELSTLTIFNKSHPGMWLSSSAMEQFRTLNLQHQLKPGSARSNEFISAVVMTRLSITNANA